MRSVKYAGVEEVIALKQRHAIVIGNSSFDGHQWSCLRTGVVCTLAGARTAIGLRHFGLLEVCL